MKRKLPPLNGIRAFEAAARHLSFTRAAEELVVSQSAISQQVKKLEEYLGLDLFKRQNNILGLSRQGKHYLAKLSDLLNDLQKATNDLYEEAEEKVITLSTMSTIATLWLAPRLKRFRKLYPHINLYVVAEDKVADLDHRKADIAIRHGRGDWPNVNTELLFFEGKAFPVCSPELIQGPNALKTPEDLKTHVLINDDVLDREGYWTWKHWLDGVGCSTVDPDVGLRFSHFHMALQATLAGEGVALAREVFVKRELASGQLVKPFDFALNTSVGYFVVVLPERKNEPALRALRNWLMEEVERDNKA